jgi:hypothetical protein
MSLMPSISNRTSGACACQHPAGGLTLRQRSLRASFVDDDRRLGAVAAREQRGQRQRIGRRRGIQIGPQLTDVEQAF